MVTSFAILFPVEILLIERGGTAMCGWLLVPAVFSAYPGFCIKIFGIAQFIYYLYLEILSIVDTRIKLLWFIWQQDWHQTTRFYSRYLMRYYFSRILLYLFYITLYLINDKGWCLCPYGEDSSCDILTACYKGQSSRFFQGNDKLLIFHVIWSSLQIMVTM